ncbi:hypothetical protein MAR_019820 [Mya arenaria]|uniref:Uncharacterized protein n=1 Tax=Mya arenaria TaxID=6604 RepID=A0ABY7EBA9_MYAAR|nr:hypothetical protein MAR_019820 [Mya arenaria]
MTLQAMKASSSTKQYCHNFNKNHTVGAIHSFRKSRFLALHIYEINIVSKSMLTELNGLVNYYGALVDEHLRSQYFGYSGVADDCLKKNKIWIMSDFYFRIECTETFVVNKILCEIIVECLR